MRKRTRKLTALQKGMRAIARPLKDRDRELFSFVDSILLLDDSGGECITRFDDATACHYFLVWLRRERVKKQEENKAKRLAFERRQKIKLVGGCR